MTRKMCLTCKVRKADPSTGEGLFCLVCVELGGWENDHSDNDHEGDEPSANCWVCHPELIPGDPRKGHTNTVAKTYSSHAACDHPRTPKHREICRRTRRAA